MSSPLSKSEEHALIAKAKQGDQDAFAALVERYQRPIYNLTLRMSRNQEDAEDLTQIAFLNAWHGLSRFQEDASFFTWLYRLATNASIDFLRRQTRRSTVFQTVPFEETVQSNLQFPDSRNEPETKFLEADLRSTIEDGLRSLSEEHSEILTMRELDGLSYQEIAELKDLELGTVKSRIARARLALRKALLQNGNYFEQRPSDVVNGTGGGGKT